MRREILAIRNRFLEASVSKMGLNKQKFLADNSKKKGCY